MEAAGMQVRAPAKINLSLLIRRRRSDGFHDIETSITPISLYDEVEITRQAQGIKFACDDPLLPQGEDNLVMRAAKAFFAATAAAGGVSIYLRKRIPYGAGLGGGSSDAAAALLGLN